MDNFLITIIITYLGLFAGSIISFFAKEELEKGKKYFILLKFAVISIIMALFFTNLKIPYLISIPLSIFFAFLLGRWELKLKHINPNMLYYGFFAVILYEMKNTSPIYPVLIFVFGLPAASERYNMNKSLIKNSAKILSENIVYIILLATFMLVFKS